MLNTGSKIVDAIGQMNFEGNIIPANWFKHIKFSSGKVDPVSILILAEIVYWHRPTIVRDEHTGQVITTKKKFKADLLQRSYESFSEQLGISKRQARDSIVRLEEMGLLKRVFRTIPSNNGPLSNVLFIELNPAGINHVTFESDPYDVQTSYPPHSNVTPPTLERHTYTESTTKNTTEITTDIDKRDSDSENNNLNHSNLNTFGQVIQSYEQNITFHIGERTRDVVKQWLKENNDNAPLIVYALDRANERVGLIDEKTMKPRPTNVIVRMREGLVSHLLKLWASNGIVAVEKAREFETANDPSNKPKQESGGGGVDYSKFL